MSTKATVAHGPNFHLFREVLDDCHIYLELENVQFEASYNRVTVPIPVHIWEVIRRHEGTDLSFADKTDEEIRSLVEREVDERISQYDQETDEKRRRLIAIFGSMPYGTADSPREEQIESGIQYFTQKREHQRQIKEAIADLERANRK